MECRHLAPSAARLIAAARTLEQAIKANDPKLVAEAHAAVGRVRERLAPNVALVVKYADRQAQPRIGATGRVA